MSKSVQRFKYIITGDQDSITSRECKSDLGGHEGYGCISR